MSSRLPKERQSAYERWEMASFGDDRPKHNISSAASLAQMREQIASERALAKKEGYAAGYAEGQAAGLKEGRAQGSREVMQFQKVAAEFQNELARTNELIAQDMLDLALDLAKAMLKTALAVRPELVLPVISEAVHYMPSAHAPALLSLHPDDARTVKQFLGDELSKAGWRIAEDPSIERGGCRVDTASNQIDATIATRWQRIVSALGRENDWLAP